MANEKISQLPLTPTSSGGDLYPLVQTGNNYAITFTNLQSSIISALMPSQLPTITLTGGAYGSGAGGTIPTQLVPGTVTTPGALTTLNNKAFSNAIPLGLLTGTTITNAGGLTIFNAAGIGYVQPGGFNNNIVAVPWPAQTLALPANQSNYVYYDYEGNFLYSPTIPDTTQNVVMGRVVTNAIGIELIEESGFNALHSGNAIGTMLRQALGPVYVSGSNQSVSGSFGLNIAAGAYYFGEREYLLLGGNPINFDVFYQNGTGGTTIIPTQNTVDSSHYDNGSGTLQNLTASYFAKHSLYALGEASGGNANEKYFVVISQQQYSALTLAEQGSLPSPPNFLIGGAASLIASIVVQQGAGAIIEILDERPFIGANRTASIAATTFHHNLLGLNDFDDHLRYLPVNGTRPMLADLPMGGFSIQNANVVNANIVHVLDIPLGDSSTKAPNTKFVDQTAIAMAYIFG